MLRITPRWRLRGQISARFHRDLEIADTHAWGVLEFLGLQIKKNPTYKAGDLLGASELVDDTDAGWVDYQLKELNNGRLAMFAIMGFWIQDLLFGSAADMLFKPMLG